MLLYQISAFTIGGKNIEVSYKNNKFQTSLTWNEKFELPDGSYSVSDIQDYFEHILKNMIAIDNPSIMTELQNIILQ